MVCKAAAPASVRRRTPSGNRDCSSGCSTKRNKIGMPIWKQPLMKSSSLMKPTISGCSCIFFLHVRTSSEACRPNRRWFATVSASCDSSLARPSEAVLTRCAACVVKLARVPDTSDTTIDSAIPVEAERERERARPAKDGAEERTRGRRAADDKQKITRSRLEPPLLSLVRAASVSVPAVCIRTNLALPAAAHEPLPLYQTGSGVFNTSNRKCHQMGDRVRASIRIYCCDRRRVPPESPKNPSAEITQNVTRRRRSPRARNLHT